MVPRWRTGGSPVRPAKCPGPGILLPTRTPAAPPPCDVGAGFRGRATRFALGWSWRTAGGAPMAPASPQPFIPNGLVLQGVTVVLTLNDTRSLARGIA